VVEVVSAFAALPQHIAERLGLSGAGSNLIDRGYASAAGTEAQPQIQKNATR
jgi:hypothetical protein